MPGADEIIVAMIEKEQEHRHRLERKQIEIWSCIMTFKIMIITIRSVDFSSVALLYIYQGKTKEGLGLIGGGGTGGGYRCNH